MMTRNTLGLLRNKKIEARATPAASANNNHIKWDVKSEVKKGPPAGCLFFCVSICVDKHWKPG